MSFAAEHGLTLTKEDFEAPEEDRRIDKAELASVAGGKDCECYVGGGGGSSHDGQGTCACIAGGGGEYFDEEGRRMRCVCVAVGAGADYYPGHDDRR